MFYAEPAMVLDGTEIYNLSQAGNDRILFNGSR